MKAIAKQIRLDMQRFSGAGCEQVGPKALTVYVTNSPDRPTKLQQYFIKDAKGLDVPISDIQPQPAQTFTGYLAFGRDDDTAICNVWTGLESPWTINFNYWQTDGWKILQIEGPIQSVYESTSHFRCFEYRQDI